MSMQYGFFNTGRWMFFACTACTSYLLLAIYSPIRAETPPPPMPAVPQAVPVLGEAGAEKTSDDQELLYRINAGRPEDVKLLLERGANPNTTNASGLPALAIAAEQEPDIGYPMAFYLIEKGADINANLPQGTSAYGDTILHIAINRGNHSLVWYLLTKGADFLTAKTRNMNAVELAQQTGNAAIAKLLLDAKAIVDQREAYEKSDEARMKMLQQYAYYVCAQAYMRYYAASGQDPDIVKADTRYSEEAFNQRQEQINAFAGQFISRYNPWPFQPTQQMQTIAEATQTLIKEELDRYVRNRARRAAGVGKMEDLQKRCMEISHGKLNLQSYLVNKK